MADSSLLNRLEGLDARYEEIGTLITDPSVIADQKRYVKLTKEYKSLENLLNAANKYKKLLTDIEEFKFLIANESDAEMREMAKEELDASEPLIPKMEEEIKLLLIPEDPEDSKNVVLELRGGTGGDEAAIFAGDLARMYTRYCEQKGWSVQVSSCTEGAACSGAGLLSRHYRQRFGRLLHCGGKGFHRVYLSFLRLSGRTRRLPRPQPQGAV